MALNSMGLGVTFTARDAMSGALARLQRAYSGLEITSRAAVAAIGGGFGAMAAGIGMMTVGLAGLESAMNLASVAGRFEAGITKVGLVAQAKGPALQQLSDAALNAAQASGYATSEVTQGLEDIAAMGFTAAQSVQMLNPALNLAAAGTIGVAEAADAMGSAMKVFGIQATETNMQQTASRLLGIANTTALQAKDLRIALGTVGRGASAAKQDLDEMLISMGLVKNTGVDATVAASSVSSALLFMAENADKFAKIGVKVEDDQGHFRDFLDVVLDVNKALEDTGSDAKAVATIKDLFQRFGITAYQGISTQLKTGILDEATGQTYYLADAVDFLRKKQLEFADQNLAAKNAEAMLKGFEGTMKRLDASWETLKITLGKGFMEVFLPFLQQLVEGLISVERFFRKLPPGAKVAAAGLFIAGSAMLVAAGAATVLTGAVVVLGATIALAGWPLVAWMAAFLVVAGPIAFFAAKMAAAFVLLGAGIYTIFSQNIGGSMDRLVAWFNKWKTVVESVIGLFSKGELTGAAATAFLELDQDTQDFVRDVVLLFKKLEVGVMAFWQRFKEVMASEGVPALDRMLDSFLRLADNLGLVDHQAYELSKTMGSDDFAVKGMLAAEAVARAFVKIADAITQAVDAYLFFDKYIDPALGAAKAGMRGDLWGAMKEGWKLNKAVWGFGDGGQEDSMLTSALRPQHSQEEITDYTKIHNQRVAAGNIDMRAGTNTVEGIYQEHQRQQEFVEKFNLMLDEMRKKNATDGKPTVVEVHLDSEVLATGVAKGAQDQRFSTFSTAGATPLGGR